VATSDVSRVPSLRGKTIAITESRRAQELSALITKLGGVPLSAPALVEVPRRDRGPALAALRRICRDEVAAIVFMTGVGARAFLALATEDGSREALLAALGRILVVVRGPKPTAVLREAGVRIDVTPSQPTSDGVLAALAPHALDGQVVAVQLHGEDNHAFIGVLRARGARVVEIPLYEWALPDDRQALVRLIRAVMAGAVDVVAFTSSPQVTHLLAVAEDERLRDGLLRALQDRVRLASIGPVCTAALRQHGLAAAIEPEKGTMGALVHAIAQSLGH
jgi:uroporphyrinogen-III synthase